MVSGAKTRHRTTANAIFHVVEGTGETAIGDEHFFWRRGDTFVAPSWHAISHHAKSDTRLFLRCLTSRCCVSRTTIGSRQWSEPAI